MWSWARVCTVQASWAVCLLVAMFVIHAMVSCSDLEAIYVGLRQDEAEVWCHSVSQQL